MTPEDEVRKTIAAINAAWRGGRPLEMRRHLHPDITMAILGVGSAAGRDAFLKGFEDFCSSARVLEYREGDLLVNVVGTTAVATYTFEMLYERAGDRQRSTGRDLWIFARQADEWIAVWRTMMDLAERPEA